MASVLGASGVNEPANKWTLTPQRRSAESCRLCRAAQLVWEPVDAEGGGSPQHVLALGIDLAAVQAHDLLADALQIGGPVPVGDQPANLHARLSSCCEASPPQEAGSSYMSSRARVADLVWKANTGVAG